MPSLLASQYAINLEEIFYSSFESITSLPNIEQILEKCPKLAKLKIKGGHLDPAMRGIIEHYVAQIGAHRSESLKCISVKYYDTCSFKIMRSEHQRSNDGKPSIIADYFLRKLFIKNISLSNLARLHPDSLDLSRIEKLQIRDRFHMMKEAEVLQLLGICAGSLRHFSIEIPVCISEIPIVRALRNLSSFTISGNSLKKANLDVVLEIIADSCPYITSITIGSGSVHDRGILALARRCPHISQFSCFSSRISKYAMVELFQRTNLSCLNSFGVR